MTVEKIEKLQAEANKKYEIAKQIMELLSQVDEEEWEDILEMVSNE